MRGSVELTLIDSRLTRSA